MAWKKASAAAAKEGLDEVRLGPPLLKLEAGKNGREKKTWIRILPPRDDHPTDRWYLWQKLHFGIGANNRVVQCLTSSDMFCPICAEVQRLTEDGNERAAKSMRAKWRALINVVEYDDKGYIDEGKVKLWTPGRELITELIDLLGDLDEEDADCSDPETGRDIWVGRKGKGGEFDTTYSIGFADEVSVFNGGDFTLLENSMFDLTKIYPIMAPVALAGLIAAPTDPWEAKQVTDGEYREVEAEPEAERPPARAARPSSPSPARQTSSAPSRRTTPEPADDLPLEADEPPARQAPARAPARAAAAAPARAPSRAAGNDDAAAAARARLSAALPPEDDEDDGDDEGDEEEE